MRARIALIMVLFGALQLADAQSREESLHLDAGELYDRSVTAQVRLADGGGSIELAVGELIEDDGPAAGYS